MAKIDDLLDANAKKIQSGIKKEFDTLVAKLQNDGMSYNDAKIEAKRRLKAVYRHTVDTIAVGMKKALKEEISPRYVEEMEVEGVKLSRRLYANLKDVEAMTLKTIKQAIKDKKSIKELATMLYEGYNFKDDPLKVKKALPKYLMEDINKMSDARIRKIKTPSLKAAYYEALKAKSDEELYKKLKNAFYERNRYYANRIAQTEIFKAYSKKEAQRFMEDGSLEVVKVRLSRTHPVTDICDYHTGVNKYGLGKGVYPKEKAPLPPYHPHCRCKMLPSYVHKAKNAKERKEADREFMSGLSEHQKARVLGSKLKVQRFERDGNVLKNSYYPNPATVGDVGYNSKMDLKQLLNEVKSRKKHTKNKIIVGVLSEQIVEFLLQRDIQIHTRDIYITDRGVSHISRESKKNRGAGLSDEDILTIPEILKNYSAIYFDKGKNRFNILYCSVSDNKCIKIAVDTKGYANRGEKLTIIKTAGYVSKDDMKDTIFELIEGKL